MDCKSLAMRNFNHHHLEMVEWKSSTPQSPTNKSRSSFTPETELSLWVLDEPFEFGVLPMQPSNKINSQLLRKASVYIKNKNMYPVLNLSAWLHISKLKLQLGEDIPWVYLRMFDLLKQQMSRNDRTTGYWDARCEQFRKGKKDKKDEFRVPTFEFLIFLYIQNSYKIMKRMSVQMINAVKKRDDRWAIKSSEPKIQSEQLHYQYLHDNIEDLIDFLQEGYKSNDEISMTIIEALNLVLCCTSNPRECIMTPLESVIPTPSVSRAVGYNEQTKTVDRIKFVDWVRTFLKLNPWGSASSFVHTPKIYPPSGSTKKENKDSACSNRIICNQKQPPYSWVVISNLCHQVFFYDQTHPFCNLKIHRCNNSYIYAPGVYNCVLIDKCINSTIFLGVTVKIVRFFGCTNVKVYSVSRLIIITDCMRSTFHLLTPCPPILTGSKNDNIEIGPYNTFYPTLGDDMNKANMKPSVSNWNAPLQIGADGMTAVPSSPVISFVKPSEFSNFIFPFLMAGNTLQNPMVLPDEYQEALMAKENEFEEWKETIANEELNAEQTTAFRTAILKSFKSWLNSTGYGKELDGLKNLQSKLAKDGHEAQSRYEFSGDQATINDETQVIHHDLDIADLFEDMTIILDSADNTSGISSEAEGPNNIMQSSNVARSFGSNKNLSNFFQF